MIEITVPYEVGGRSFEGRIVRDDDSVERPILFMQPDWFGVCDETITQAKNLARGRYVVFLADMFGAGYGSKPKVFNELLASVQAIHRDLPFTLSCGGTAYDTMRAEATKRGLIKGSERVFSVGYCAGAGFLMEQARAGADFEAVVLLHITNPNPAVPDTPCAAKGRVMVIHGAADPVTTKPMLDILENELTGAGVEWRTVLFSGAEHAFCVPSANFPGAHYNEKVCRISYRMMHDFFAEGA